MSAREYYESTPGQAYQSTDSFWKGDQHQQASTSDPKHFIPNSAAFSSSSLPQYSSPAQPLNINTSTQQQDPLPIPPPKISRISVSSPPLSIPAPTPPEPLESPQMDHSDEEPNTPITPARFPPHMTSQLRPESTFYVNEHNHHNNHDQHYSIMPGNGPLTHTRTPSLSSVISYSTRPTHSKRRREKELTTYSKETLTQLLLRQEHDAQESRRLLHIAVSKLQNSAQRLAEVDLMKQQFESERKRLLDERVTMNIKVTEALMQAKQESVNAQQELSLVKLRLRHTEDELDRAKLMIRRAEQERDEAESVAKRARDATRRMREDSAMREARDQGRQEGFEEGIRHGRAIGVVRSGLSASVPPQEPTALPSVVRETDASNGTPAPVSGPSQEPSGTHARNVSGSQAAHPVSRIDFEETVQKVREEERRRYQDDMDRMMEQEREKSKIAFERVVAAERDKVKEIEMRSIQERQRTAEALKVLELEKEKERELRLKEQNERERERDEREHMRRRESREREREKERQRQERERELEEMRARDRERDEAIAKATAAATAAAEAAAAATSSAMARTNTLPEDEDFDDEHRGMRMPMPSMPYLPMPAPPVGMLPSQSSITTATMRMPEPFSMPEPTIPRFGSSQPNLPTTVSGRTGKTKQRRPSIDSQNSAASNLTGLELLSSFEQMQRAGSSGSANSAGGFYSRPSYGRSDRGGDELRVIPEDASLSSISPQPARTYSMPEPTIPRFGSGHVRRSSGSSASSSSVGMPVPTIPNFGTGGSVGYEGGRSTSGRGGGGGVSFPEPTVDGRSLHNRSSSSRTQTPGGHRPSNIYSNPVSEGPGMPEPTIPSIVPDRRSRQQGGVGMPEATIPSIIPDRRSHGQHAGMGMPEPTIPSIVPDTRRSRGQQGVGMPEPTVPSIVPDGRRSRTQQGVGMPEPTIPSIVPDDRRSRGQQGEIGMPEPTVPSIVPDRRSRSQQSGYGMPEPTVPSIVPDSRRSRNQQVVGMPEATIPSIVPDGRRSHGQGGVGMPEPTVPSIVTDDRNSRRTGGRSGSSATGATGPTQIYTPAAPRPVDMDRLHPGHANRGSGNGGRGDLSRSDSHNSADPSRGGSTYDIVVEPPSQPTSPGVHNDPQAPPHNNYLSPYHATLPLPQAVQHHRLQQQREQTREIEFRRRQGQQAELVPTEPNTPTDDEGGNTLPQGFVPQVFTPHTRATTLPSSAEVPEGFIPQTFTPHTASSSALPTDNVDGNNNIPAGFVPQVFTPHTAAPSTLPADSTDGPPGFVAQVFTPHTAAQSALPGDNDEIPAGFIPQAITDARTGVTTPLVGATTLPSTREEASSRRNSIYTSQTVPGGFGSGAGPGAEYHSPYRPTSSPVSNEPPVIPSFAYDDDDIDGGSSGRQRTSIYASGSGGFTPGGSSRNLPGGSRSNGTPAGGGVYQNPLRGEEDEDGEADNLLARNTKINATAHVPNIVSTTKKGNRKKKGR